MTGEPRECDFNGRGVRGASGIQLKLIMSENTIFNFHHAPLPALPGSIGALTGGFIPRISGLTSAPSFSSVEYLPVTRIIVSDGA